VRGLRWDHNAWYHPLLLRRVPRPCDRALDVGCGTGAFAARLAGRAAHVDAVDRSPAMVAIARARVPAAVTVIEADVLDVPLPSSGYDVVTSICALHHMPLEPALERLAGALRPGGVLAVVGLPRRDLPRELGVELAAALAHRLVGAGLRLARTGRLAPEPGSGAMPLRDAELTVAEVRRRAGTVLPGVRVRRLLFWRYLLLWRRPPGVHP
jgi:SAM-dependent methyltransferase